MRRTHGVLSALVLAPALAGLAGAQAEGYPEVGDIRYVVSFDRASASARSIRSEMSFHVYGSGPVVLSIPAWTPGSYELDNFARFISDFSAESSGQPIRWDKADFDSWRVHPDGAGRVTVRFRYHADTLDTGMAGAKDDFAFFNGTTVFPYPEGQSFDFPARVSVVTEPDWLVATGMRGAGSPGEYEAATYHELVDMPFFVGRFDLDSTRVDDRWYRLATYPSGTVTGEDRERLWEDIEAMIPPMAAVFGETPWVDYTILALFEEGFPGGAALEHRNSHLGIYAPQLVPSPILPLVMAHETFHAWNVKRLRPEELWPYEYDRAQPTTLLWVSEGVTDYYADLALVRGGIVDPDLFYQLLTLKIRQTEAAGPVSLEDASVSTWIEPDDGTATIYYQKGSLAGLFLDILIRDATDNRTSLDQVMRDLYDGEYRSGSGFTEEEWWAAVSRAADGASFEEFRAHYIEGREPYPWNEVLPLAGMRVTETSTRRPFIGAETAEDAGGLRVTEVSPGSPAEVSGIMQGDVLVRVDDVRAEGSGFANEFRHRYADAPEGTTVEVVVLRDEGEVSLETEIEFTVSATLSAGEDPEAGPKARAIREGIFGGRVDD